MKIYFFAISYYAFNFEISSWSSLNCLIEAVIDESTKNTAFAYTFRKLTNQISSPINST